MSGKWDYLANTAIRRMGAITSVALLCTAVLAPGSSQAQDISEAQNQAASADSYERFEAERRRQELVRLENSRLQQEKLRFENERLRQENERREQARLRLENERLRQENERHELEQLRLQNEAKERELAQAAALREQSKGPGPDNSPDIYEQLQRLGQLKNDGILTEEEFQRLKNKILN